MNPEPDQKDGSLDSSVDHLNLVRICPSAARAHDDGLILLSAGWDYWVLPQPGGYALMVEADQVDDLQDLLNLDPTPSRAENPIPAIRRTAFLTPVILFWILIAVITSLAWKADPALTSLGVLQSQRVWSDGEVWRLLTALSLHADIAHLVANMVAGIAVTAALAQWMGSGKALLVCLSSGVSGNLLTLVLRSPSPVVSLGASTAVFGSLGALAAMPGLLSGRNPFSSKWVPLATGLVVLGIYGAGDARTDVLAHVCGFATGWIIGRLSRPRNERKGTDPFESFRLFLACLVLPLAWLWALLK